MPGLAGSSTIMNDAGGWHNGGVRAHAIYDQIGTNYAAGRRPDPRWAAVIEAALGSARSVINVGAGTGSYESTGRRVLAVEPSPVMIAQRPPGSAPVVRGVAERLPCRADAADAVMALLTMHHWSDWRAGMAELRRVAPRRVVLSYDAASVGADFWLVRDYLPEVAELESGRVPPPEAVAVELGGAAILPLLIPPSMASSLPIISAALWAMITRIDRPSADLRSALHTPRELSTAIFQRSP